MKIPKIFKKDRRKYIFEKKYPNFYLYKDTTTEVNRCFTKFDLGLTKKIEAEKRKYDHVNRSNYSKELYKFEM